MKDLRVSGNSQWKVGLSFDFRWAFHRYDNSSLVFFCGELRNST